ncbi:MAG: ABC transporter permease subunit [Caldilineaceae bacterium]
MNIYAHEFKKTLGSVITWSVALIVLIIAFMSMFSSIAVDAALLNEMMANFPPELLTAFGMTGIDMSSVLGYYGLIFTFVQICLAVQAANYGFALISVEEADMTADFLLTKPVGRGQILTSKLLAVFTSLTVTNGVVWISTFLAISLFSDGRSYDNRTLLLLLGSIVIFQLVFLSLGVLISLLVAKVRNVTPFSMGLAFGMYVLNAFGGMLGDVKLEYITPFKHFEPAYITSHAAYNQPLVVISLAAILISIAGSYALYLRRNIHTAV